MSRIEIAPPCHVPPAPGTTAARWSPWLEAALALRVSVPEWGHAESAWVHWAVPGGDPAAPAQRHDPGRFAVAPGTPEGAGVAPALGEPAARSLVDAVLGSWRPALHRHPGLDLVSRLDEPREAFRRRCLALLRPMLSRAESREATAARLAEVAAGIETIALGAGQVEVEHARVGVVWYPDGREPAAAQGDMMLGGDARSGR